MNRRVLFGGSAAVALMAALGIRPRTHQFMRVGAYFGPGREYPSFDLAFDSLKRHLAEQGYALRMPLQALVNIQYGHIDEGSLRGYLEVNGERWV